LIQPVTTAKKITRQIVIFVASLKSNKDIKDISKKLVKKLMKKLQFCKILQLQAAQMLGLDLVK